MLFCIKKSFVWWKKIVFDESFYEIVLLLIQFFSCTWLLLFLRAGRLCNVLSDLRLFFYSFDDFFSMIWWNTITVFFPRCFFVRFSVSCFFKKRKVFFLLISKKGFCWMNWIVCRLSCRRICFFSDSNFFFNGIKKNFIVWKKFFYMCPFFIHRNHGWKKKVDKINEFEKKRNDVYLQMVMIFSIHFFLFFRRSWQLFQKWVRFFSEIVIV